MSIQAHTSSPPTRRLIRVGLIGPAVLMAMALLIGPATAFGQTTPVPTSTTPVPADAGTPSPTPAPAASATSTPTPGPSLTLSSSSGAPGSSVTANGTGFRPGETVEVAFNGQPVGQPTVNTGGTFSLSFSVPNVAPGDYGVLAKGQASGSSATSSFTVNVGPGSLAFTPSQAAPGTSLTVAATGFQPGESVQLTFNGASVGMATADTNGAANFSFAVPSLAAGQYGVTATGETSKTEVNATYTVSASSATPAPTATPAPQAPTAPAIVHDDRYFSQTGFRIDDDQIWAFFSQYGGVSAFGYPVSRNMSLLGCPVQMFQRQVIQVCQGAGAALINLLDPEIFNYTKVNGSTFPAPDPNIKDRTPQVGSPTYSTDIVDFVNSVVPDSFNGQPVNFLQTFNTLGGLTIWGAPISNPEPDPANGNFIYQRFQRGIMHYIAGQGTQSILLADYLKAIMMNQNVPTDLLAQSQNARFFNQYCPGQTQWLCRPSELPGTDLTYAFVNG